MEMNLRMLQRRVNATLPRIEQLSHETLLTLRCLKTSGLAQSLNLSGVREAAKALLSSGLSPSLIYRIHAANTPNRIAIRALDRTVTFAELDRRMNRLANALVLNQFCRGDRAIVMLRNSAEFIEIQGGVARAGGAVVNASTRATADELAYLVEHSGARWFFFGGDFAATIEAVRSKILANRSNPALRTIAVDGEPIFGESYEALVASGAETIDRAREEDSGLILYTSGTTGSPKGAVRRFPRGAFAAALQFIAETPMRTDDKHLVVLPLYHGTAYAFVTFTHLLGGTIVIAPEFTPTGFLSMVDEHAITTTAVVPTMLHRMTSLPAAQQSTFRTATLRAIFSCGAPLPAPLASATMNRFGSILFNAYGATETGLVTLAKPADLRRSPDTIGHAVAGSVIRLVDDQQNDVPPGAVGELYVKNSMLVAGYHDNEEATRSSMLDGYFSVGDLARRTEDGLYFLEGRARDLVISGGVNIYPAEVERVFEKHPAVAEIAVIGVPDDEWGERLRAFVVKRAETSTEVLRAWGRDRLASVKVPREFVFVEELPRNPTGKVLKTALRGM